MTIHSSILDLKNLMDRGAWWATIHRITKDQTPLSDWAHSTLAHGMNGTFYHHQHRWYYLDIIWLLIKVSVQFNCSIVSNSLWPHGLKHARLPCPTATPRACSNSCPLSRWCHPTISSSAVLFSSCLQSFLASGYFPMSQFFTSGDQSIRDPASALVLLMNIQDWFPLGLTG